MTQTATEQATTSRLDHIYPTLTDAQVARGAEKFEAQVG